MFPGVFGGKAHARPWLADACSRQQVFRDLGHARPRGAGLLTASIQGESPEIDDVVPERIQHPEPGGHRVIAEPSAHDLVQPVPLIENRSVHAPLEQ